MGPELVWTLISASGASVSAQKTDFWLVGLYSPPEWIPSSWTYIRPRFIAQYLGIPFGVGLSPISLWEWCL
jgi:hypothetical protein